MADKVVRLRDHYWGGMLSIWGQGPKVYQGVCYSGLCYSPNNYVDDIRLDGPPVDKYLVRYVDLELANNWLAHVVNHILPDEVLKQINIVRPHSKGTWPARFQNKLPKDEVLEYYEDFDMEYDDAEAERARVEALSKKEYAGCMPWLKVSFDQTLPPNVMFAVGVLLRYVSEHGMAVKMLELLPQIAPEIPVAAQMCVAQNIGGARGHALGGWGYAYANAFKKVSEKFDWKGRFMKMMKLKPFGVDPLKHGQVDEYFTPTFNGHGGPDVHASRSVGVSRIYTRDGFTLDTTHNAPDLVLNAWLKKEKA